MPEIIDASADDLLGKSVRTSQKDIKLNDGRIVKIHLIAMGSDEYDDLVAKHPPTKEQRAMGAAFDVKTFGPALLSRCLVTPAMDPEQCVSLFSNPAWSGGELTALFNECLALNLADLDADFTVAG